MSLIAPLIRLAAADDEYAQDLRDALDAGRAELDGLVRGEIQEADLVELTPAQWQWYASWRQELGGELDRLLLDHLTRSSLTRFTRFQVRELVLRDRETNQYAPKFAGISDEYGNTGLNWLSKQAQGARIAAALEWISGDAQLELMRDEAFELMNDALQCATEASWFLLRQLMSNQDVGHLVRQELDRFADRRGIVPLASWYAQGKPLEGN
jgi:hypothetical protein